jgi:hypothetical protein
MRCGRITCTGNALLLAMLLPAWIIARAQQRDYDAPPPVPTSPGGALEKDSLKDFHRALEVQATSAQIADFQAWLQTTASAKAQLQPLLRLPQPKASTSALDQALDSMRTQTKNFIDGFSEKQAAGLKEQIRLLDRVGSELAYHQQKLNQALQISSTPTTGLTAIAGDLEKSLDDFSSEQLALAREMGIVLANSQDVTFNLPAARNTVTIASQPLQFTVSGLLSETAADAGIRSFRLEIMDDLTDLQQNVTDVMGAVVNTENACGERLSLRRAVLMPAVPAGSLSLQLHYERWACLRVAGQVTPTELAEKDGDVEIRLLPAISQGDLQLKTAFGRIGATGMMADSLRNGDLGSGLRDKVAQAFLSAMGTAINFKSTLPAALQGSKLETAQFGDDGAGDLTLMLQGDAQLSEEQVKSLTTQLNQTLAAEGKETK